MVYDAEFDTPLPLVQVTVAETGEKVKGTEEGNYVFPQVPPGTYTLVFSKQGYTRQVKGDVVVTAGQMTEVNAQLSGEFTEMEEFVVQDVRIGGPSERALLELRMEAPALMDSIGAELMSRAGASDAAGALKLVAGATVQEGKFAVIRGLPDRFVNSQLNGIRLPSADADTRAVELDQFPAAAIESVQVSKTFTPDQQGDASGGAVNVVLKGVPDEAVFKFSMGTGFNSQVAGEKDFLTYHGGGVDFWGEDDRPVPTSEAEANVFEAAGVSFDRAPMDYKWSVTGGGNYVFDTGTKIGAIGSFFYERDSEYYDEGIDDSLMMTARNTMVPQTGGKAFNYDRRSSLLDMAQGTTEVKWGGLAGVGIETENHKLDLIFLHTQTTTDTATLAEDTRGKQFFYPGHDPNDPTTPGHKDGGEILVNDVPWLRRETLKYTERTTQTLQLKGRHTLPIPEWGFDGLLMFLPPEIDWTRAFSKATRYEPDERQFGSVYQPAHPNFPQFMPARFYPLKPGSSFALGNFYRMWTEIVEESDQYSINLKLPFTQWTEDEGYVKLGVFNDEVQRTYDQETFFNQGQGGAWPELPPPFGNGPAGDVSWNAYFSQGFASWANALPLVEGNVDVDYDGEQNVSAWYYMMDLPLVSMLKVIGGVRYETTKIGIVNFPDEGAEMIDPETGTRRVADPDEINVTYEQDDMLPSLGFVFTPIDEVTVRGSRTQTVARQVFKELTPIKQQEYLGGDIYIGNPNLDMPSLENFDLRLDYRPYEGGLVSISWFKKEIKDPIENVQRATVAGFTFMTPMNFPKGTLQGWEFEVRQDLGHFWDVLKGLAVGANATFIDSEVVISPEERSAAEKLATRDMTNAPEYLYNLYATYDLEQTSTQFTLFYTFKGDTLIAGTQGSPVVPYPFAPSVYAKEYGTLNLSIVQRIGEHIKVKFAAKNLTNPEIETVYRSWLLDDDVTKTSYTKGIDYSIGISAEWTF
ncbi:MAG: TonB-dependent receptor [Phycisphaerae bacterium]